MPIKKEAAFAWGWIAVCLIMLLILVYLFPRVQINSSVLSLLPQTQTALSLQKDDGEVHQLSPELEDLFLQRLERQLVFMVRADDSGDKAAMWFYERLQELSLLRKLHGPMSHEEQNAWGQFAYRYRNNMLDEQTRLRLNSGKQAEWILSQVYSVFSGVSGTELENDPLLLVRGAQMALLGQQSGSKLMLEKGWLTARGDSGERWYFFYGELKDSSYSMSSSHEVVLALNQLKEDFINQWPGGQIFSRGTIFYTDNASTQAQQDIKKLGSMTIFGVLLLIFLVFRSLRPLFLCILSIASGALVGTVGTLLVFGHLHLMTLVLSISVVGVSTDYAIYYLSERLVHGGQESSWQSMRKMAPTQWLALVTTVIAYLIMLFAPFPGLQQLAVFASAGLCGAGLTVMLIFPYLVNGLPVRPVLAMSLIMLWLLAWRTKKWVYIGIPLALFIFSLVGIWHLRVDDDIAQLQSLPEHVLQQERMVTALSGQSLEQKWFSIQGRTQQEALERLASFKPVLNQAQALGLFSNYRILPLHSVEQQKNDFSLLQTTAPQVMDELQQAGLELNEVDLSFTPLTPNIWLESPVSQGWRLLWASLGADAQTAILVPVSHVTDTQALADIALQYSGVDWVDRKESYSSLFRAYRTMLAWLLAGAVLVLLLSYVVRLGLKRGLVTALPSILSLMAALGTLGVLGISLNLFGLLALILVLGIGINYTLFFANPKGTPTTSMMATTLAFLTTLLTLGVLVFSHTHAISSFGLVLSCGIFIAFLTSPLALYRKR